MAREMSQNWAESHFNFANEETEALGSGENAPNFARVPQTKQEIEDKETRRKMEKKKKRGEEEGKTPRNRRLG